MATRKIKIFDTTLRDGEQVPGAKLNAKQKLEIALQLERLGVDVIEAGFPCSSPGDAQAVKNVAQQVKKSTIAGLARAVQQDIDICWESVRQAESPRIHVFLGSSDIHVQKKLRMDREKAMNLAVESVKYAKSFCSNVEYSTEDASRTDFEYLCRVIEAVIKVGATTINVPILWAMPSLMNSAISSLNCGRVCPLWTKLP